MKAAVRPRIVPAGVLALFAVGGVAAWVLWPSARAPLGNAAHSDDDLDWLAAPKAAREAAEDLYAADSSGIYWTNAREHAIRRMPADAIDVPSATNATDATDAASTASTASTAADASSAASGEQLVRLDPGEDLMAIATGDGTLCFASGFGGAHGRMAVRAGPEAGGPFKTVRADGPPVLAIACDRDDVFVVTADDGANGLLQKSTVERLPLASRPGDSAAAIAHSDGAVTSLALDQAHVFYADSIDERIIAMAKIEGNPEVLAEGRGLPRSIVAFGDALFWVEQRGESVWTMPKSGGAPRLVVQDFAGFSHLTAGPGGVFWVNEAAVSGGFRVLRAPLGGGDATSLSPAVDGIDALMVVGTKVLWARDGHLGLVASAVAGTAPSR